MEVLRCAEEDDRRIGMSRAEDSEKFTAVLPEYIAVEVMVRVNDEGSGVLLSQQGCHFGFEPCSARESEIDERHIESSAEDLCDAQSGAYGESAANDTGSVIDQGQCFARGNQLEF